MSSYITDFIVDLISVHFSPVCFGEDEKVKHHKTLWPTLKETHGEITQTH